MEVCEETPDDIVANGNEVATGKGATMASVADACDNSMRIDSGDNNEDPIFLEYRDWKSEPCSSSGPEKIIELKNLSRDDEGKASLVFNINHNDAQQFTLYCPNNYPVYRGDEDNFFLEAEPGLLSWCNAVNEYILDTNNLRLSDILTKSLSLYRLGSRENNTIDSEYESDSEESYIEVEEDGQLDDCLDQEFEWGIEVARRKTRWREKEKILRAETKSDDDKEREITLQEAYHESTCRNSQPKQVFTSEAASGILINDIVNIMGNTNTLGIEADTVDDNIFQWNVKMRNFLGTPLDDDLKKIEQKYGYHYIELQLDFSKDLYPFFPPLVKVIRPRLQGSMMLRVTTMEILKLTYWNPTTDMASVLTEIRNFLSTWARLEVGSERNDRVRYPLGAYNPIEHHLLRLALVSEIVPRANNKYKIAEPPAAVKLPSTAVELKFESNKSMKNSKQSKWGSLLGSSSKKKADGSEETQQIPAKMAKGVGYSTSYSHKGWDVQAFLAAKKEKDKQIELVLVNIIIELKRLHHTVTINSSSSKSTATPSSNRSSSSSVAVSAAVTAMDVTNHVDDAASNSLRRKRKLSPEDITKSVIKESNVAAASKITGSAAVTMTAGSLAADDPLDAVAAMHLMEVIVEPINPLADLFSVMEGSALIPFIESKLQANSFLEIGQHIGVYRQVVGVIRELCQQPVLCSLLAPLPEQHTSIHQLLHNLEQQANIIINRIGKASANGSVPKGKKKSSSSSSGGASKAAHSSQAAQPSIVAGFFADEEPAFSSGEGTDILAKEFQKLGKEVAEALKHCVPVDTTTFNSTSASSSSTNSPPATTNGHISPEPTKQQHVPNMNNQNYLQEKAAAGSSKADENSILNKEYCDALGSFQWDSNFEFEDSGPSKHYFQSEFAKTENPSYQSICRVAQDIASLTSTGSLPLNSSSSIFVRSDENKSTLLRCIITGPEGTPYSGGVFEFDIFFPNKYPSVPPKVHFRTTGGMTVRFNPNLYQDGKVCLSLLGTWDGAQGEHWNQHTSTILQVLISIQSLILCPEPYYNEPGFERKYGTECGLAHSAKYNEEVLKNNLRYAISDAIKCPPVGFEEAVNIHFYLKRHQLIKELLEQSEGKSKDLKKLVAQVTQELLNIKKPQALNKK